MVRWHLQYRTKDRRWVILIEWRHPLNLFRRRTARWIVGESDTRTFPVRISGSRVPRWDARAIRRCIVEARTQIWDEGKPGDRSVFNDGGDVTVPLGNYIIDSRLSSFFPTTELEQRKATRR